LNHKSKKHANKESKKQPAYTFQRRLFVLLSKLLSQLIFNAMPLTAAHFNEDCSLRPFAIQIFHSADHFNISSRSFTLSFFFNFDSRTVVHGARTY